MPSPSANEYGDDFHSDRPRRKLTSPPPSRRPKKHLLLKILLCLLALVLIAAGSFTVLILSRVRYDHSVIEHHPPEGVTLKTGKNQTNILLFGVDNHREGENGRADTMILLTIDHNAGKLKQTSFLRDIYVEIPGHGENKLNAAFAFGGPTLAAETIENAFHIRIDRYVIVDFNSFTGVIDALGGISIPLTQEEVDYINWQSYRNHQTDDEHELKAAEEAFAIDEEGRNTAAVRLSGRQALWYARDRDSAGSDFDRTQRQRRVINIVLSELKAAPPWQKAAAVHAAAPYLTTNMDAFSLTGSGMELMTALRYPREEHRVPTTNNYYDDWTDAGMALGISDWDKERKRLFSFLEIE